jgi:hypothetical protein
MTLFNMDRHSNRPARESVARESAFQEPTFYGSSAFVEQDRYYLEQMGFTIVTTARGDSSCRGGAGSMRRLQREQWGRYKWNMLALDSDLLEGKQIVATKSDAELVMRGRDSLLAYGEYLRFQQAWCDARQRPIVVSELRRLDDLLQGLRSSPSEHFNERDAKGAVA